MYMPAPIDEMIKRRVVQQWLSGEARDKIAADNNISSGTVSTIVDNCKIWLDLIAPTLIPVDAINKIRQLSRRSATDKSFEISSFV
jgi:hypothetical protein